MPKALKNIIKKQIIFVLLGVATSTNASGWQNISPGIEYQDIGDNTVINISHIHVFRIDLKNNKLSLALAKGLTNSPASAENFAKQNSALIAINGGFFDKNFQPLGLRINANKQFNPIKYISWWGVFYINKNKAFLSNARNFNKNQNIDFAIQSGPRLIIDNKIPSLKPGYAERSALGITTNNKVIILITQNNPLTTTELAKLMQAEPLNCNNALNLDGGSSSQLYANMNNFKLNVNGFSEVSDAILVNVN